MSSPTPDFDKNDFDADSFSEHSDPGNPTPDRKEMQQKLTEAMRGVLEKKKSTPSVEDFKKWLLSEEEKEDPWWEELKETQDDVDYDMSSEEKEEVAKEMDDFIKEIEAEVEDEDDEKATA